MMQIGRKVIGELAIPCLPGLDGIRSYLGFKPTWKSFLLTLSTMTRNLTQSITHGFKFEANATVEGLNIRNLGNAPGARGHGIALPNLDARESSVHGWT